MKMSVFYVFSIIPCLSIFSFSFSYLCSFGSLCFDVLKKRVTTWCFSFKNWHIKFQSRKMDIGVTLYSNRKSDNKSKLA